MSIYYNPKTRTQFPQTMLYDKGVVSADDPFYRFYSRIDNCFTFATKEDARNANSTGPKYWFEEDGLHNGHSIGSWDCIAVTEETQPVFGGGINWGNAYFTSEAEAHEWLIKQNICQYDLRYEELGDVWCVHYHY